MSNDLDHLIELQQLETAADGARRLVAATPQRIAGLDAQLAAAEAALAAAREQKAQRESDQRTLDKDLAAIRARRSKFLDQTIEVKTNREYHALQHEIQMADEEIERLEDRILENMLALDETNTSIAKADAARTEAEGAVTAQKQTLEVERKACRRVTCGDCASARGRRRQGLAAGIRDFRHGFPWKEEPCRGRRGQWPLQCVSRSYTAADRSGRAAPRADRAMRELHAHPLPPGAAPRPTGVTAQA